MAVGISDLNGSFLDDLVRQENGRWLHAEFQVAPGRFEEVLDGLRISNQTQWNIVSADFTGNGLSDIVSAGAFDGVFIFRQISPGTFEKSEIIEGLSFFAQTANAVDINNDGFLDLFICDDLGESKILANDGNGNFSRADEWIDMKTVPVSDNSGNYGSVWSDVTGNGKMDLYISKCRGDATSPSDPRRINQLFINHGNGHFEEAASQFGIADGGQSWASDFGDINNNGLMDLIVLNHPDRAVLYLNNGNGSFEDITLEAGIGPVNYGIQVQFADFDNDGFADILISGLNHYLYLNNGDNTFLLQDNPFSANSIASFSVGDLNDDGFLDIYASYTELYNNPPGQVDDAIWMNEGNENNWLRLKLNGVTSNRDGIGAVVKLYSDLGIQTREVRAGESFGIQTSRLVHFGLARTQIVDSIVVSWPSGQRDVFSGIHSNTKYLITEGICISPVFQLEIQGDTKRCNGDSVVLSGPEAEVYFWNNGATEREISITENGQFFLRTLDDTGCEAISDPVYLEDMSDFVLNLSHTGNFTICSNSVFELGAISPWPVVWSDGREGEKITIVEEGLYFAHTSSISCGEFISDTLLIALLEVESPVIVGEVYFEKGPALLEAEGENIRWYDEKESGMPAHIGNSWLLDLPPGEYTRFVASTEITIGEMYRVGMEDFSGTGFYPAPHLNGGLVFDALQPFLINSLKMYSEFDGPRVIEILNREGELIASDTVYLSEAANGQRVSLQLEIPAGQQHLISTNRAFNQQIFGVTGPRLYRSNRNTAFPYAVDDVVEIQASTFGAQYYYFFYDWEISLPNLECESKRVPVHFIIDAGSPATESDGRFFKPEIFPNPTADYFQIQWKSNCESDSFITLYDAAGRVIKSTSHAGRVLDLNVDVSGLSAGVYLLQFSSCQGIFSEKIIVE